MNTSWNRTGVPITELADDSFKAAVANSSAVRCELDGRVLSYLHRPCRSATMKGRDHANPGRQLRGRYQASVS